MSTDTLVPYELEVAVQSDTGSELGRNEDHVGFHARGKTCALIAVADGEGTDEGGGTASRAAVETLVREFAAPAPGLTQFQHLVRAARAANYELYERSLVVPRLRGLTTTLTAVAVTDGKLTAAHVGNSRVYLLRDGYINQLSKDHTARAEALEAGQPFSGPGGHAPIRTMGRELLVPIDLFETALYAGDTILACTDGLYHVFEDADLARLLEGLPAAAACRRLVDEANGLGALDNLSMGVLRVVGPTPATGRRRLAG
jgi:serine/threonine protein phosphatase PrpC